MRKVALIVMIAFLCLALIPSSAYAATGTKIEKKTNTENVNGGSLSTGTVNFQHWVNGEYVTDTIFVAAWSSALTLNASILAFLQGQYPTGDIADLLAQIEGLNQGIGNELVTVEAVGDSYTLAELEAIADDIAIGQRGGVYEQSSTTYTFATATETGYNQVGNRITQTTTTNNLTYSIVQTIVTRWVSPLVLDMAGKGVLEASKGEYLPHSSFTMENAMLVDFHNNGFEVAMEWVGPNDGLLVAPRADGSIDATCLFGTTGGYDSGFQKLSLWDKNKDGQVSGDEIAGLAVWQDKNQNGAAEQSEIQSLTDAGISSLSVTAKNYMSSFVRDGKTYKMWDWWPTAMEVKKLSAK